MSWLENSFNHPMVKVKGVDIRLNVNNRRFQPPYGES